MGAATAKIILHLAGLPKLLPDDAFVPQGAALGAMVGQMTYGKRQFENLDSVMRRLIPPFHEATGELLLMVDADSSAFNCYMVRRTLPSCTFTTRRHQ